MKMFLKLLRLLPVILMILLVGCSGPQDTKIDYKNYKKITPQEAEAMMSDNVIVLDVRTQEEFDEGHIINAVLLPDYEIEEKAQSVLPDKTQTVLIYCRTGRRSKTAAEKLIEMGYTKVFDFGGIDKWIGGIVRDGTDAIYYNYFGGDLPPDVITPINFEVSKKIHKSLPSFTFHLEGERTTPYQLTHDKSQCYTSYDINCIKKITIIDSNGTLVQQISDLDTSKLAWEKDVYGFSFDDWNFDGFIDISLWQYPGGTMMNNPTYYWLWDTRLKKFVENENLKTFSDESTLSIDSELKQIKGFEKYGNGQWGDFFYEYRNGNFVLVKTVEHIAVPSPKDKEKNVLRVTTKELINGKMVVTNEYFEDGDD